MKSVRDWRVAPSQPCSTRHVWWNDFARPLVLSLAVISIAFATPAQIPQKQNVLVITEVGFSHTLTTAIMQQLESGVQVAPDRHVEFYTESFDLTSLPAKPTPAEVREWLAKKYSGQKIDVVVALGPNVIRFLANQAQSLFPDVPIVICGADADQAGKPKLDSQFTGTWVDIAPAATLNVALQLFPDTRHVVVVAGTSRYDKVAVALTKAELASFDSRIDITYLSDLEMGKLLAQLRQLPKQTIVLYVSYFQDAAGNQFVNATKALPMVRKASSAPVFGMSDTYLGHGIVGGVLMNFEEQGKATARIVSALLDGKKAEDIPIVTYPSVPMFDWHELQEWHIAESMLPPQSVVLFREPGVWERTRWLWITALLTIFSLSVLVVYLQYNRTQLQLAKERQTQLSGMLINAEEKERRRVASDLHDDFSQRLALLALGLQNAAEGLPASAVETTRQLHELVNSASELGADLHTLSHHLHSSTLDGLGLVPGVSAFCKEFHAQHGVEVEFNHNEIPRPINPDIGLCVFRIVQEGLRNVHKHSGVNKAEVSIHAESEKLKVFVSDEGHGFDIRKLKERGGLGISSMEERVHLMGGQFKIRSEYGRGTRLEAWVPFEPPVWLPRG